jgi:hypothetical protein
MNRKVLINEKQLHNIVKRTVNNVLKEWDDVNDESYREKTFIDDLYNIRAYIDAAIEDAEKGKYTQENGSWWLKRLYDNCKSFIINYDKVFNFS